MFSMVEIQTVDHRCGDTTKRSSIMLEPFVALINCFDNDGFDDSSLWDIMKDHQMLHRDKLLIIKCGTNLLASEKNSV